MKTALRSAVLLLLAPAAAWAGPYCAYPQIGTDPNCTVDAAHAAAVGAASNPEWTVGGMKFVLRPVLALPQGDLIIDMEVGGPSGTDLLVGTYTGGLYLLRNGVLSQVTTFTPPAGHGVGDIGWGNGRWYISTYSQPAAAVNNSQNNPFLGSQPDAIRKGSLMISSDLVTFTTKTLTNSTRTNPVAVLPSASSVTLGMNNAIFAQYSADGTALITNRGGTCFVAADGMVNAGNQQAFVCNGATGTLNTYDPANFTFSYQAYAGLGSFGDISTLASGKLLLTGQAGATRLVDPLNLASATSFSYPADFGLAFEAAGDENSMLMLAAGSGLAVYTANTGTWYLLRGPGFPKGHRLAQVPGAGNYWSFDNVLVKVQAATGVGDVAMALGAGTQYATLLTTLAAARDGYCQGTPALNKNDFDCQWQYLNLDDPTTYTVVDGYCPPTKPNDVDCKVRDINALYGQAAAIADGDLSSLRPSFGASPGTKTETKIVYYGGNAAASSVEGAMSTDSMADKAVYLDGALDPLWEGYAGIVGAVINPQNNPGPYNNAVNAGESAAILAHGVSAATEDLSSAGQSAVDCAVSGNC